MAQPCSKNIQLLLLFIQLIYFHILQSKEINTNPTSIICNDPISCELLCINNKCDNLNYNCINTPICNVKCSKNECINLTLDIHSDTIKTRSTVYCEQCSHMHIIPTTSDYSQIINCNKICQDANTDGHRSRRILSNTQISAEWTNNFLSILITFKQLDTNIYTDIFDDCSKIFDDMNLKLIGTNSKCIWNQKNKNKLELMIDLSSSATINLDSKLQIWDFIIDSISIKGNKQAPDIILGYQTAEIGVCDDLILDARSTTGLGGRDGIFMWKVININDNSETIYYDNYVVIDSQLLQTDVTYTIQLTVGNWYGESAYIEYNIYKYNMMIPMVILHGINEYSPN
eukprot:91793_1